jgi:hypothetical protein
VLVLLVAVTPLANAEQPTVVVKATLEPVELTNNQPSQLIVQLQASQQSGTLRLEVTPPPGFQIRQPAGVKIASFQGSYTASPFFLEPSNTKAEVGSHSLLVRVFAGEGTANVTTIDTNIAFTYVSRISIPTYFLLGGLGIFFGYLIRLLVKVLQAVPAPAPEPDPGQRAVGLITGFVQRHYYFVDCSVTLSIGLISLSLLLKDNHVPDSGMYWYSALGAGFALGLLTNSELLSKVR